MFIATLRCRVLRTVCLAVLPLAAWTAPALAATSIVPASSCQPMLNGAGKYHLHQSTAGLVNAGEDSFGVICPVNRPHTGNGVSVVVLGSVQAGTTLTCTLSSNIVEGGVYSMQSFTVTGAGFGSTPFSRQLSMNADIAPYGSFQSVACSLPGSRKARLRGLLVNG